MIVNMTVPLNIFSSGDVITAYNTLATPLTIAADAGVTMRLAGTATTGTRTVAGYGIATIFFTSANICRVSGPGVT
jgi:hypothetical protein